MSELVRLPLWRNCVEAMREEGINYGHTYASSYFEERLKCKRDTMQFGLAISEIRRELEKDGYYLSGRGQKGDAFVILMPEANADVMQSYQQAAVIALKRGVILGTNTRLDTLDEEARRKHESILEKLAMRAVLLNRSAAIYKHVKANAANLLDP